MFSFFKKKLYWSIIDLQCCVNFTCTAKWFRYTHTHTHTRTHVYYLEFFSYSYCIILGRAPCAIQWSLLVINVLFIKIFFLLIWLLWVSFPAWGIISSGTWDSSSTTRDQTQSGLDSGFKPLRALDFGLLASAAPSVLLAFPLWPSVKSSSGLGRNMNQLRV